MSAARGAHGRPAERVVSLIASATETVAALGFADRLVGISHECDYPPEVVHLPRLSAPKLDPERPSAEIDRDVRERVRDGLGLYGIDVEALRRVRPDLIVTQDHCDVCAVTLADVEASLAALGLAETRVCALRPGDLGAVRRDFVTLAEVLGGPERGEHLVKRFDAKLAAVSERVRASGVEPVRVVLLEWLDPPMVAGAWMPELARAAGGRPLIVDGPHRFREVVWADLAAADPDAVVVLPCGFGVARSLGELENEALRRGLRSVRAVREGRCWVLDGNAYFNRPGPRLAESAELLCATLHPDVLPGVLERYEGAWARWA